MGGSSKLPPGIWAMNWPTIAPVRVAIQTPPGRTVKFKNGQTLEVGRLELQPPLEPGQRDGILAVPNPFEEGLDGGITARPQSFDPDVVRGALLLFDRFEHPSNSMMLIGEERPAGLDDFEAFQRSRLELSGHLVADVWKLTNAEIFAALQERDEGLWAIARGSLQECLPQEAISPQVGLQLKMLNALPLPDRGVPYEDVLNFKERHKTELGELRGYLDELALEVVRNGSGALAQAAAFEKFDRALAAYAEAARGANFAKRLFSLDVSFSLSDAARAAVGTALVGTTVALGVSPILATAGAALYAGVSANIGLKGKKQSAELAPFEYVFRAHDLL